MITVEENTPFVIDDVVSIARARKLPVKKPAAQAVHNYREAYRKVYGILPEVKFDGQWYRVKGQTLGVNLKRLKEMTTQLEYRNGDHE